MNASRHRPTISDNPQVGAARHDLYKNAIDKYRKAMKSGFYIEAISLMESLISDRIESLLNAVAKTEDGEESKEKSFLPLGQLVSAALKCESVSKCEHITAILDKINDWKRKRNGAIHEMAKLSDAALQETFADKYDGLKSVAEEGYTLFREFDTELTTARKNKMLP